MKLLIITGISFYNTKQNYHYIMFLDQLTEDALKIWTWVLHKYYHFCNIEVLVSIAHDYLIY